MSKDELGYEYLRRTDGGVFIIAAWVSAAASIICAAIGALISSFDLMLLASGFGSLWAVLFITGYVTRAIYFMAGDSEKPRSRSGRGTRWHSEEGYRPSGI